MKKFSIKKLRLSGVQILALGFIIVILIGGILLSLPISSANGESTNFLDALFTSTSAVCVTGLVTLDTGTHWNEFGQIVIMLLIEVGGLGFMSFATFIAVLLGKKITLRDRLLMQEAMNTFNIQGLVRMVRYVLGFTFSVQFFGALLLSTQFIPQFGFLKGVYFSIFHSISAFCNAGFDLFGGFSSVTAYSSNAVVLLTISSLIIIGGLGFTVWLELYNYRGLRKLSVHSKIVILITVVLLIGGTILMYLFEMNNPQTIGNMGFGDKILNSYFASASPRTAGFNSVSTDGMTNSGKFLTIILMFIGGSPGSTAGGLKTATFGIVILTVISVIRGREDTQVFGRRFSKELVYKSFALLIIGMALVIGVSMLLSITDPNESFINILYEATSAFGTVGLTTGVTQRLSTAGKIIIMITMYCGRVGPMTVALAFLRNKKKQTHKYPEGKILIG
ncbi:TrkH family potassium uptake protein [Clostridium sardiniense]|uniref:TrkH family potassium uptake protein n=1 Tax=Clostridium sardiniense TaxID=29369 RepID=A0ABS7KVP8_CLOSR|nr:TrkH family potassium uptake protein [Clostridium sardiniense]MBY0754889.1 TrkH family potassium uptake protein [Clostridium sardiniense]MDQ0461826.1 trk system potassium uptake protein TrkH [Clostridium sardiniense]